MAIRRIAVGVASALLAGVLAVTVTACAQTSGTTSGGPEKGASSAPMPTGTSGAVDFDKGYITLGSGSTAVDTFIDPMCPYCGEFEKANGSQLGSMVNAGRITLRIHPMTFLDQSSDGTKYSSRASASLACVAAADPTKTLVYLASLYADQPAEGSSGLTDDELVSLAKKAGADDVSACITGGDNIAWAQKFNHKALDGGITGADITSIKGTPTILVNGHVFPSNADFTNPETVKSFITSGGK